MEVGTTWVTAKHPHYERYKEDEDRQRASYVATRRALVPFLVPHRFEGQKTDPEKLNRAKLGYGVGLNRSYVQDLLGHIRGATARYTWGPLDTAPEDAPEGTTKPPTGGLAKMMWDDATLTGMTLRNFFLRRVLEWMCSSPGGVIVVDAPPHSLTDDQGNRRKPTEAEVEAMGLRPYFRFVRWSAVEDFDLWKFGLKWVKILERGDDRDPKGENNGDTRVRVLYELLEDRTTQVSRWKADGTEIGTAVNLGEFRDTQGQPMLPIPVAVYGDHPEVDGLGAGLIADLADIIIDIFNVLSETREGFRDAAFGIIVHKGADGKKVQGFLDDGSRFIDLGPDEYADLRRVAGTVEEVVQGLALMQNALESWHFAARQKAADAMQATGGPRSGISLAAEFQLDIVPLLREIAGTVDALETECLFIAGQFAGYTPEELKDVGVERSSDFRPEEEASRIARLLQEFRNTGMPVPAEAIADLVMAWLDALDFIDLDKIVEPGPAVEGEEKPKATTLREFLRDRVEAIAKDKETNDRNQAAFFGGGGGALPAFPVTDPGATA